MDYDLDRFWRGYHSAAQVLREIDEQALPADPELATAREWAARIARGADATHSATSLGARLLLAVADSVIALQAPSATPGANSGSEGDRRTDLRNLEELLSADASGKVG